MDTTILRRGPLSVVDDQSTESSGLGNFSEQVWSVFSERGQCFPAPVVLLVAVVGGLGFGAGDQYLGSLVTLGACASNGRPGGRGPRQHT